MHMKVSIAVCLCLLVGTCAASPVSPDSFYSALARAALDQIETPQYCARRNCNFTYVVPTSVDTRTRTALAAIRKVVAPSEVPESAKASLSNNVEIDKIQIVGNTALVEGNLYPYGHNSLNCGEGFSFSFQYANNVWVPGQWRMRMC
jgi:hypothetical protein